MIIFEYAGFYNNAGEISATAGAVDIGRAVIRRTGTDLSTITYGGSLFKCLEAAEQLAQSGISAEVIDLRPLDEATLLASVRKIHRVLVVDEGWETLGLTAKTIARLSMRAFYDLDAPPARLCTAEVPIPYPKHLEDAALPQVDSIVAKTREVLAQHV